MKQTLINTLVIALVLFTIEGSSQTLSELINTALSNNYEIQIYKNEAQIASNNNTIGNAGLLPSVDLKGTYSTSFNNTLQTFSDGSTKEGNHAKNTNINLSALANWTVFNGFSVYAKREQLRYLEELGQINSKFYIEQTVSDIVATYYQLIYEKQVLENFRQSLTISAFRLTLENKRKEVGAGKIMDYGQALVDYQTDSIRLIGQQNLIESLTIEINRILSNNLEKQLNVSELDFNLQVLPMEDSLLLGLDKNNNQLEQQRLQELISETELRMERANHYPKIDLFAGYQYNKTSSEVGFFNSNQNYGPTVGVTVSFNLFNGGATNRSIKNAKI